MQKENETGALNAQTRDLLNAIATLTEKKEALIGEIAEMIKAADKPIYEAKARAGKIIAEAEEKAKDIIDRAGEKARAGDIRISKKEGDLESLLASARKREEEALAIKEAVTKERVDFDAYKYSLETNLAQRKAEADKAMSSAISLQQRLDIQGVNLDSRQSTVIKKEEDYQANMAKLEQAKSVTQSKIDELAVRENSLADEKIEISALGAKNEEILKGIKDAQIKNAADIAFNQGILDGIKATREEIRAKQKEATQQFNSIAEEKAKLDEQAKSLNEKDRLQKLFARQIDEKITVLNKLREG